MAAETVKNTVEQFTTAGNVAFKDAVEKSLASLNEVNAPAKEYLAAAGVAVYDDAEKITTHAKMLLADDRVVIGSANWGYDAIERRNETCVVIHDPGIAAYFLEYFNRPALRATPFPGQAGGG